jgi:AcrR family transcriptional regulator
MQLASNLQVTFILRAAIVADMAGLRERNRRRTMRELQNLALDMFEAKGFDTVTVEEIADAGGVSASTIYRYFGTKEHIVTWDETDQALTTELIRRLTGAPPIEAFRDTLVAHYGNEELNRPLLRRVRFIYANPQVHAAAIERQLSDQSELALGFAQVAGRKVPSLEDSTRAGFCMAAVDAAVERWQRADNDQPLAELITLAFAAV